MGKLFKRNGVYYADLRAEGFGKRSLHTETRRVAKERLRLAELGATGDPAHAPKPLAVAIENMASTKRDETASMYRKKGLHLCRVFGAERDINTLARGEVADYVALRKGEGASTHTIHKELVTLRQTLKEARIREEYAGTLDVVPEFSAEYSPRDQWLTPELFKALLAALPSDARRTWVMLECFTSANLGEVKKMGWEHVDFANDAITVPGTKRTSRYRKVPLHEDLRAWLEKQPRTEPLVAPWKQVARDLTKAGKAIGLANLSTNDLRRTFGSWLKQSGVDSAHVAMMMGHSSTTMVDRVYGKMSDDSLARAMAKMRSPFKVRPAGVPPKRTPRKGKRENET